MYELSNFDSIQIGLASPEKIREWSHGEVTKPETINYRTQKPEKDGLFCEKIFGPSKDWECHCGRYKRVRYKGVVCEKCGVEVTKAKVRRERMGHIELATPVSHIWYFRGVPSRISLLLDISPKELEQVLYFVNFIVLNPGAVEGVYKKQVISDKEYNEIRDTYDNERLKKFRVGMGAEAIKELLMEIDLDADSERLKQLVLNSAGQKRLRAVKRLEIVEAFRMSGNRPEWMILDVLPVLPPDLRPMVQLDGGRYATSDLNDLYRRVINRNNRLKKLKELGAPDIIVRNEKRMLQEAVDALIDNGRRGKAVSGPANRDLKSLSGFLRGKQGRFRQNLLGKRVDYSGRSVIVVGPELKLYQCGLPKEMALELFKPFIMKKLVEQNLCHNIKSAKRFVDTGKNQVWDILEEIIKDHPVLLNRAPTLHRLGIQAFEPVLVEGRAIKLHPLACGAFNADFDGDQMAVHVPLSIESQVEARILMLCTNNILKLSDGKPIVSPTQDMVIGSYYLTIVRPNAKGEGKIFSSFDEAVMAYTDGDIALQSLVYIRSKYKKADGTEATRMLHTTVGRCIFNNILPQDLHFIDRDKEEFNGLLEVDGILGINASIEQKQLEALAKAKSADEVRSIVRRDDLSDEAAQKIISILSDSKVDVTDLLETIEKADLRKAVQKVLGEKAIAIGKKQLSMIVDNCFKYHGATETASTLDLIKSLGFKYSTIGAVTASVFDMHIPAAKKDIIAASHEKVLNIERNYSRGIVTDEERYQTVIKIWKDASDQIEKEIGKGLDDFNPIWMMANSGARGNMNQIRQLTGMRGLMADPSGRTIELPVLANFREGLSVLEYFISSHGGRKGLADTALKTADSGYLTRRLVDVSHSVIVREQDCGDSKGMWIGPIMNGKSEIECLRDRIVGRYSIEPICNPTTGEIIVDADSMISPDQAAEIENVLKSKWVEDGSNLNAMYKVHVRSVLTCKTINGVCAKCYGKNMASGNPVKLGEAVGIIAAQSIGEPGTQLTMRTFHTGGVATSDDITQGLPRVEELFEARKPRGQAIITENDGFVHIEDGNRKIIITGKDDEVRDYDIAYGAKLKVAEGDEISAGDPLTYGSIDPQAMLRAKGVNGVQEYIAKEVQSAYRLSGVEINDKHVDVIVRQMLRKVRIEDQGDTTMLPGTYVDIFTYEEENEKTLENGGRPASAKRTLLGITKAALATESFLSAASFQETTKVLADAAIKNKIDPLLGLKENVIIGKIIPAGTGMRIYKNITTIHADSTAAAPAPINETADINIEL